MSEEKIIASCKINKELDERLIERIQEFNRAGMPGVTRSQIIRWALMDYLKKPMKAKRSKDVKLKQK